MRWSSAGRSLRFSTLFCGCIGFLALGAPRASADETTLSTGWQIQSAPDAHADGATISTPSFTPTAWHPAAVPTTILSALVKDGTYKDIFFGKNLASIPAEPFTHSWWYRKDFDAPNTPNAELIFEGINFRATVFLNGQQLAGPDQLSGAYRILHLDVTGKLHPTHNILAVEVSPPKPDDYTLGFVDWNPTPPDHDMGLFRPVKLHTYNHVSLDHLFVESKIDHATWTSADLTLHADLHNADDTPVNAVVTAKIGDLSITETFPLQPHETKSITLTPANHPELHLQHAQLWYPWELGTPHLYTLQLTATINNQLADQKSSRFGIRETKDYMTPDGYRGYMINGQKILIRGGGWADDLLLDEEPAKLEAQLEYTKQMNLNTIRCEGFWGSSQQLYDLADEKGLLIMVGWSCQWEWHDYIARPDDDFGTVRTPADIKLMTDYLHDQVLWLRDHPSIFVWVLGSDKLPRPALEKQQDSLLAVIDPSRPTLKSCGNAKSTISGPTGVKMEGPYDYESPNYWYLDTTHGGAYGFNTETGPGPQPPVLDALRQMIPADQLWPINDTWNFHCGQHEFTTLKNYLAAYNQRYGEAKCVEEFATTSQIANYEAIRPMYEAFAVNRAHTTGIVQWMLNASWPKMYWQLIDYSLEPGGAYFGAKKGAAPLAIIYNYGDHAIYLANQTPDAHSGEATITVYDLQSHKLLEKTLPAACPTGESTKLLDLSTLSSPTPVYFIDLRWKSADGQLLASNFYWLSTKPDVLNEPKSEWFYTPISSYADFTALHNLPAATVDASMKISGDDAEITLHNTGDTLAFFLQAHIDNPSTGHTLAPVYWSDNDLSLLPHETRVLHARLPHTAENVHPLLHIEGLNSRFTLQN
jgi:exo-1,4-beta-D-glucosaminidase